MDTTPIDAYLDELDEPKRSTLRAVRAVLRELLPDAEECLSYGVPAFKVDGKAVAGFAAFARHLSYLPHSGAVLAQVAAEVSGYATSKGAVKFAVDEPLPRPIIETLVAARLRELSGD